MEVFNLQSGVHRGSFVASKDKGSHRFLIAFKVMCLSKMLEANIIEIISFHFHFKILYPGVQFSFNNCFTMYPATKTKNNL